MRLANNLIRRGENYFRHRLTSRVLILLYHRIVDLRFDPHLLSITPQHFEEHLEILSRYTQPMRLGELAGALRKDRLPRRGVVITFDDGYIDNLQHAKPALERRGIPATVFVTAGQIGCETEFWWDALDRLFLQPGVIPKTLSLVIGGREHQWDVTEAAEYTEGDYQKYLAWHIECPDDPSARHRLYRSIYRLLHDMDTIERRTIIEKLQVWAGSESFSRPSHRALTADEVLLLAKGGLIEIGAHTVTHPALAGLPVSRQQEEIKQSKACLEDLLNRSVDSFAYPHGSYTDETISIIQEAEFRCACSSDTDAAWRGANVFTLPRVVVRDWDGDEFARWLKGWFGV